ncbi:carbohydrate ABC transporter substrate-binding protein (CUT1 family) [Haloactinopolyspora alba]|uniref:Carbohydrate ABC transporter substrate-binding protein (CUT1 family) n=1 Tax=Haloactinopolyspora alba TaxID=648780 RepID=A0A2P8DI74_9ACTN|nr:sugar ABC transporter substrate-binding protein [Haloactinopolyspora alba]PSK96922.1 carbohydrate ABC transporter substrate-binding protein (CUT1 family) [Haloactinopolyspora alba]
MRLRGVAVAATAGGALVLAACGGSGDGTSSDGSSVTLWMYPVIADEQASAEYWKGIETDFESKNDGVDLKVELLPWEGRQEKITTALASGTGPDVVLLVPDMIPQYVEQGTLTPVGDIVENSPTKLLPNAVEAMTVNDEVYGVPIYQTVNAPIYNTALFEQAGINEMPQTWDAILEAAPKLAANDVAIYDYFGGPEESLNLTFYPLLWQAGGQVFSDDGSEVAFDSPEGVEALQFLLDLQAAGGLTADAPTVGSSFENRAMATSDAAMTHFADLTMTNRIAEAVGPDKITVGEPIEGPGGKAVFGIPGPLTLAEKAKDNDGAKAFLNYMLQPDVLAGLAAESGFFPPSNEVEVPDAGPLVEPFSAALEYANPGPIHPMSRQVMAVLASQIQAALLGNATAEEALTAAAEEANALLSSGGS